MKFRHIMPFGAEQLVAGGVRFNFWAPGAKKVELVLYGALEETTLAMNKDDSGWCNCIAPGAATGSRYCYRIDGGLCVPDPASRFQPEDVHAPSQVVDPTAFDWQDTAWQGRPWHEAVIYELHVGTFTPEGTFTAAIDKLDYLAELGITAIELMPIADFPGQRNWGYDGVLPYAPDAAYGDPDDLKALIQAAHARGLMVLLDVVYNHFGPEGNYLHVYAPQFFTDKHHTPWGAAINFDDVGSRTVRDFFIHNALYWLTEYRFDGLRLDAVHAILDDSEKHILTELAEAVQAGPAQERMIHLILENDTNQASFLDRDNNPTGSYTAQWNDDIHHAFHVLLTEEKDGYYSDYADDPAKYLARCLAEGFAWQGEPSPFRSGELRGEISSNLPPQSCVNFMQNHDQIGNRAFGERLARLAPSERLQAATAVLLLAPAPPLLFMGEEFGAATPFLFFCDFGPDLSTAVREGRRKEFAQFKLFSDPAVLERIPDPGDPATTIQSKLDWSCLATEPHQAWLSLYRKLLALRRHALLHRLEGSRAVKAEAIGPSGLRADWRLADGSHLSLLSNLGAEAIQNVHRPHGTLLFESNKLAENSLETGQLNPNSTLWYIAEK